MSGPGQTRRPGQRGYALAALLSALAIFGLRATDALDPATAKLLSIIPIALLALAIVTVFRTKGRSGNPAYAAYKRRMGIASAAYVSAIALAVGVLPDNAPPTLVPILIALVPGFAVVAMIWAIGRLLIELDDEYLRLLEVRKFIVATGVLLAVAGVWGLLELLTQVPRLPMFYAFPIWCLGLLAGTAFNKATMDEDDGGCL